MTRIRPTLADYHKARDLEWYEAHAERLEYLGNSRWLVFVSDDPYDHRTDSEHDSLSEAIRVAREPVGDENGSR